MQLDKLTLKSQEAPQKAQRFIRKHLSFVMLVQKVRSVFPALIVVGILALLTGCQTTGIVQSEKLAADLKAGKKSILLLRVTATMNNDGSSSRMGVRFAADLGQMDKHKGVEENYSVSWETPSAVTGKQGRAISCSIRVLIIWR